MNHRSTGDGPFCWQSKEALRRIHDHFSETNNLPSAFAVYLALSMIASDEQSASFTIKKSLLAYRAGLSVRSLDVALEGLQAISLLKVETQGIRGSKLKAPSTYTLLPTGNGCLSIGNGCASIGNERFQASVAEKVEESEKNLDEESPQERADARGDGVEEESWGELCFNIPALDDPPPHLVAVPGFVEAWEAFGYMRQEGHQPLSAHAAELLVGKLSQRPSEVVAALWLAVENGWQGFEWEWFEQPHLAQGTGAVPAAQEQSPETPASDASEWNIPASALLFTDIDGFKPEIEPLAEPELRRRLGAAFRLKERELSMLLRGDRKGARRAFNALDLDRQTLEQLERLWRVPNGEMRGGTKIYHATTLSAFLDAPGKDISRARALFAAIRKPAELAQPRREALQPELEALPLAKSDMFMGIKAGVNAVTPSAPRGRHATANAAPWGQGEKTVA